MKWLIKSLVLVVVIFLVMSCHKEFISEDFISVPQKLELNEAWKASKNSQIQLKVLEIDKANNKCLIEVRNLENKETAAGWVNNRSFISFAPDILNPDVMSVAGISEDSILIEYRWGRSRTIYKFGI